MKQTCDQSIFVCCHFDSFVGRNLAKLSPTYDEIRVNVLQTEFINSDKGVYILAEVVSKGTYDKWLLEQQSLEEAAISDTMFNWISVKDKLPPLNKDVLVCLGPNFQVVAQLTENKVWVYGLYAQETASNGREYWMNLPTEPGLK